MFELHSIILARVVTVCSTGTMLLLIFMEVMAYLTPQVTEDLFVDTTRGHKLKINLDVYVPQISCNCKCQLDAINGDTSFAYE